MTRTLKLCPNCGRQVPPDAPAELCPSCLVRSAFSQDGSSTESKLGLEETLHIVIPEEAALPEGAPKQLGSYELLERIAQGGMGVVYKARHTGLDRVVALKMIRSGVLATPRDVERFQREARSAAKLRHPNIVTIHDIGEQEGQHYYTMDYVPGENLSERARTRPFSPRQAAEITAGVAAAIHYAHQSGVLHRDIKPANVILTPEQQPRVLDFGLALILTDDSNLTQTGTPVGSPPYMPPEQAAGQTGRIDARSDVYGLGALLYELLTGHPPFRAASTMETLRLVIENEVVPPRRLNPALPPDLETICLKCLEKDPDRRYQSAQELGEEMGRFIRDEPILARPISRVGQAWRWCRRKPAIAALATATILLLLAVVIGSPIAIYRINRARGEEGSQRRIAQENARQARGFLYAADMNLAQQALKVNNIGRARRLLERHIPQPGQEELRGWEWRYLWQLTRSDALATLTNRPAYGYDLSFSPDGTRLAAGWGNGFVGLWDVPRRRYMRGLTDREYPHQGRVAFSPVRNLVVATSEPKVVRLHDLDSGRESILWRAPDQGVWDVRDMAFSQDGSKVVIYAGSTPEEGDAVWVVSVSSSLIESHHRTLCSVNRHFGAARLSPDNNRLYLARSDMVNNRYSIQCLDRATGQELWETEHQRDLGLSTLAISPDGRTLVSASGFEDSAIRVWDAETGRLLFRRNGHTSWVGQLAFTRDGRRLISAATDQSIRFWDTSTWTEMRVLRGHTDEAHAVAISDAAHLVASAGKDGNLILWDADDASTTDGYRRLPEDLGLDEVLPLDQSRVLLLPQGKPPRLVDFKGDSTPQNLPGIGSSKDVLGWFGTNILCLWNGADQVLVQESREPGFTPLGAIVVESGTRPSRVAYNAPRQFLAWAEENSPALVHLQSLASPGCQIELNSDVAGLRPFCFSGNGSYLAASAKDGTCLRVWNVETGRIVASINEHFWDVTFAAGGKVLVLALPHGHDHEIVFCDLLHPERIPRRVPGRDASRCLAVSPDGGLVAASDVGGLVRLFDPTVGKEIASVHGHLNAAYGVAFSPDGRRLISAFGTQEAIKVWDVETRQELLTLGGAGTMLRQARWTADGDVILVGAPWQAWRAPSWEEISIAEAKEKTEISRAR